MAYPVSYIPITYQNCEGAKNVIDSGFTSPSTPILDERGYSPVSAAGDDDGHQQPNNITLNSANSDGLVFTPTPLPCLPKESLPGSIGRKRSAQDTLSNPSTDMDRILSAIATMERKISGELNSLRDDIRTLHHSVEELRGQVERNSGEARVYTEHIQKEMVKGVNHLSGLVQGRQERLQKASTILQDLLSNLRPPPSN